MILNQEDSLILIVDIQEKLINATFNKDIIKEKAKILAKAANILNIPIIITEQYPQGLGSTLDFIKDLGKVYTKIDFNALTDNNLLNEIKNFHKKQIIVMGIETHICVHQTVNSLLEKGYETTIVSDACGSRTQIEYLSGLECMRQNGAKIKTTEMILFELLKSAKHPNFKEIQTLIK